MRWLWIEQKCLVVLQERTPKYGMGQPDVIGVTPGRYLTEIEIKRSAADFRKDFDKPHRRVRFKLNPIGEPWMGSLCLSNHPRQFYYMMPPNLAEKLKDQIPDWAGLMTLEAAGPWTKVIKVAPVNKESTKLNAKQCARLARQMTAHMMGFVIANHSIKSSFCYGGNTFDFADWVKADKGTYQI